MARAAKGSRLGASRTQQGTGGPQARRARRESYLTFNVASPIIARINEMIQNRITIVGSAQPFFS